MHAPDHGSLSFAWSLKPILIPINLLFGIDLDQPGQKSRLRVYFTHFLCFFWLFCFIVPLNLNDIINGAASNRGPSGKSFVLSKNFNFSICAGAFFGILLHVTILVSTPGKRKPFWETLQELRDAVGDETEFYRRLRRDTIKGLLIIATVIRYSYLQGLYVCQHKYQNLMLCSLHIVKVHQVSDSYSLKHPY